MRAMWVQSSVTPCRGSTGVSRAAVAAKERGDFGASHLASKRGCQPRHDARVAVLRWKHPGTAVVSVPCARATDSTTKASTKQSTTLPWHPPLKHRSPLDRPVEEDADAAVLDAREDREYLPSTRQLEPVNYEEPVITFVENKLLSEVSTWGIGGPAKLFVRVKTADEMSAALRYCQANGIRWYVVGKGSNCLFDDRGYDGCIILNQIAYLENKQNGVFRAGSGYFFNTLGMECSKAGYSGLEFAGGIPGTVGGAVYMNAGADGQDTASALESVEIVTTSGELRILHMDRGELPYGYRMSPFQKMEGLAAIVAATFRLTPDPLARERQVNFLTRRRKTQPLTERSAGCVFRNPGGAFGSAGALIDQAGLKGTSVGDAAVSHLHANFLINRGNSNAADMNALIAHIKELVRREYGVQLQEEVKHVPYGMDDGP